MTRRNWTVAVLAGVLTGLAVAGVATLLDWRENPGGIFHGDAGTDWRIVFHTAASWFLPVAPTVCVIVAIALLVTNRR